MFSAGPASFVGEGGGVGYALSPEEELLFMTLKKFSRPFMLGSSH